jgi:hypothetical protein
MYSNKDVAIVHAVLPVTPLEIKMPLSIFMFAKFAIDAL